MDLFNRLDLIFSPIQSKKSLLLLLQEFCSPWDAYFLTKGYISSVKPELIKLGSFGSSYFLIVPDSLAGWDPAVFSPAVGFFKGHWPLSGTHKKAVTI